MINYTNYSHINSIILYIMSHIIIINVLHSIWGHAAKIEPRQNRTTEVLVFSSWQENFGIFLDSLGRERSWQGVLCSASIGALVEALPGMSRLCHGNSHVYHHSVGLLQCTYVCLSRLSRNCSWYRIQRLIWQLPHIIRSTLYLCYSFCVSFQWASRCTSKFQLCFIQLFLDLHPGLYSPDRLFTVCPGKS